MTLIMKKHPKHFLKPKWHQKMMAFCQSTIGVIHYSIQESNQSDTAKVYCQQLGEMHIQLSKMHQALFNRRGSILLNDNVRPHISRYTAETQRLYESFLHPPISADISPTDCHFFKHLDSYLSQKTLSVKENAGDAFKDFSSSLEF